MRNRAAIEWYFELLLIFASLVCQSLCSFINGNLRRKPGLLKNSMKIMDCNCLTTTTTMFGFCFGFGYTGRAVDKTRNMEHPETFGNIPEHPGTSNNYDNYERKCVKLNFELLERSDWSSEIMFLSAGRTTLPRN